MRKPPIKHAQMLGKVFPQANIKFDPHEDCIANDSHKKKKRFVSPKSSCTTVVLLKKFQKYLPKGEARKKLIDKNQIKTVNLSRTMTPKEVKSIIVRALSN